jgi:hypothetical protein
MIDRDARTAGSGRHAWAKELEAKGCSGHPPTSSTIQFTAVCNSTCSLDTLRDSRSPSPSGGRSHIVASTAHNRSSLEHGSATPNSRAVRTKTITTDSHSLGRSHKAYTTYPPTSEEDQVKSDGLHLDETKDATAPPLTKVEVMWRHARTPVYLPSKHRQQAAQGVMVERTPG